MAAVAVALPAGCAFEQAEVTQTDAMKTNATQKEFLKRMSWIVWVMGAYNESNKRAPLAIAPANPGSFST